MTDITAAVAKNTIDVSVMKLAVAHLIALQAKQSSDPETWLRQFANDLHAVMDKAPQPPAGLEAMLEMTRSSLDGLMSSARNKL